MLVARELVHRVAQESLGVAIFFAVQGDLSTASLARELFAWPCNIQVRSISDGVREDVDRTARSNRAVDSKIFFGIFLCDSPRGGRHRHGFWAVRSLSWLSLARFDLGNA
jgi:hypothetical protein